MSRYVVAAEWVGFLSSRGPRGDELRLVPGGVAHAFDRERGEVVCGADATQLDFFWTDFELDDTIFHCSTCAQRGPKLANVGIGRAQR